MSLYAFDDDSWWFDERGEFEPELCPHGEYYVDDDCEQCMLAEVREHVLPMVAKLALDVRAPLAVDAELQLVYSVCDRDGYARHYDRFQELIESTYLEARAPVAAQ